MVNWQDETITNVTLIAISYHHYPVSDTFTQKIPSITAILDMNDTLYVLCIRIASDTQTRAYSNTICTIFVHIHVDAWSAVRLWWGYSFLSDQTVKQTRSCNRAQLDLKYYLLFTDTRRYFRKYNHYALCILYAYCIRTRNGTFWLSSCYGCFENDFLLKMKKDLHLSL